MSNQSREAFLRQLRTGKAHTNQVKVYRCLTGEHGSAAMNLEDFRKHFSGEKYMAHQTLTSALCALMDMGVIAQNPHNGYWYALPEPSWESAEQQRSKEKYDKWVKRGMSNDWFTRWSIDRAVNNELSLGRWRKQG